MYRTLPRGETDPSAFDPGDLDASLTPTEAGWAAEALQDPEAFLSDHAHCERKAAQTALSLVATNADRPALVRRLARLAEQEANHHRRVLEILADRGLSLRADTGNPYAQALHAHSRGDLTDRLIVAALIEARSRERLGLVVAELSNRSDGLEKLVSFYEELEACEAGHGHVYLLLAVESSSAREVADRLKQWIEVEDDAIGGVPRRCAVH